MIESVQKCMRILSVISDGHTGPVPVADISRLTGIPKSTCIHILNTLIEEGYVERISHTKGYTLGPSTYYLARFGGYNQSFVSACRPVTRWLSKQTGCLVVLAVIHGNRKYVLDKVSAYSFSEKPEEDIYIDDIYRTATGRVILSHMNDPEIEHIYSVLGPPSAGQWPGVSSLDAVKKELHQLQKLPFVRTEKTVIPRTNAFTFGYAMPVFERYRCIGALGVSVCFDPVEEDAFFKTREPQIINALRKATREINRRMKYEG